MKSSVQYCIKYYVWVWFWLQITVLRIFQHKKNIPNQELEQKTTESLAKVGIEYNLHSDLDSAKKTQHFSVLFSTNINLLLSSSTLSSLTMKSREKLPHRDHPTSTRPWEYYFARFFFFRTYSSLDFASI